MTVSGHYHSLIHRHDYPPPRVTSQLHYIRTGCTLLQNITISACMD